MALDLCELIIIVGKEARERKPGDFGSKRDKENGKRGETEGMWWD